MDLGVEGRPTIAAEVGEPVAGHSGDDAPAVDAADLVEPRVGDVEVAGGVEGEVEGQQLRRQGRAAVARGAPLAVAGDGRDRARRVDPAQAVAVGVGDVDVAVAVEGDVPGVGEGGRSGRTAVARAVLGARAGERGDDPRRVDLAHPVVERIGDVQVPLGVDRHAVGPVDLGRGGGATVAGEPLGAGAGDGRDDAGRVDLADPVAEVVGDVQVPGARRRPRPGGRAGRPSPVPRPHPW